MFLDLSEKYDRFRLLKAWVLTGVLYRQLIASIGARSIIRKPILIRGGRWTTIGRQTRIRDGARLEVIRRSGQREPRLTIGDRVLIEQNLHLICSSSVEIGDDVMIAANCSIVDTTHPKPGPDRPNVGYDLLDDEKPVRIERGVMLGVNVVVLPGVTIGAHSIIGANSVVNRDVPANVVAVGAPAKIVQHGRG